MDFSADTPWLRTRAVGVLAGAVLAMFANAIPKAATSARGLAIRRLAGWALVLGGIAYALAWMIVPLDVAASTGLAVLLLAIASAVLGAWRIARRPPGFPSGRA